MKYFAWCSVLAIVAANPLPPHLGGGDPQRLHTFTHESCPGYELVAVDPSSLSLDKVQQDAGYLNTPSGGSLFYWFFESRNNPETDPVVIWLNGGPGCSSMEAVLFENGPVNIDAQGRLSNNTWSWNNEANVLYIDNPSGVGYSTSGQSITNTITASDDFKMAMKLFFTKHPKFLQNTFHMAGESYAGRYIPVFASAINSFKESPVNVSSVLIGNGLVNPVAEYASYAPMLCGEGGHKPVISQRECQQIKRATPRCLSSMRQCMDSLNGLCDISNYECSTIERAMRGLNPYDIRDQTCRSSGTGLCYPELDAVQNYFNQDSVRHALGADAGQAYQVCNNQMNTEFYRANDPYAPTYKNVTSLLDDDIAVLIYNGDADIILNWLGARQWTHDLVWKGQNGFQNAGAQPSDWNPTGKMKRGEVTNFEKFTFLRVHDAGHMVPHDQPESASLMVKSWLQGDYGFKKTFDG